jgi:hypothetical protein
VPLKEGGGFLAAAEQKLSPNTMIRETVKFYLFFGKLYEK